MKERTVNDNTAREEIDIRIAHVKQNSLLTNKKDKYYFIVMRHASSKTSLTVRAPHEEVL